jgi:hypothetical protein
MDAVMEREAFLLLRDFFSSEFGEIHGISLRYPDSTKFVS